MACLACLPFNLKKTQRLSSSSTEGFGDSTTRFKYGDLSAASNGFSKENLLGEGGFGCVYMGVLANGRRVAVKNLKKGTAQGEKEFRAEVEIISRIHHRHLVNLVGYCVLGDKKLLVYDYAPNNALDYHLHKNKRGPALDWPTRLKIAIGAARGLAYLHEDCKPRVVHRDIKSSNILLDKDFEAQVSDFGLAKLIPEFYTHVTTAIVGTFGYLAPEYVSTGRFTAKSDVFSFGVVLLELLTGKKPVDTSRPRGEESLVEWARPILEEMGSEAGVSALADPSVYRGYDSKEMVRMAEAAAACIRHSADMRPRMGQVVRALEEEMPVSDMSRILKPGQASKLGSSCRDSDGEDDSSDCDGMSPKVARWNHLVRDIDGRRAYFHHRS